MGIMNGVDECTINSDYHLMNNVCSIGQHMFQTNARGMNLTWRTCMGTCTLCSKREQEIIFLIVCHGQKCWC